MGLKIDKSKRVSLDKDSYLENNSKRLTLN